MKKKVLMAVFVALLAGTAGFANNGVVVSPYYNNRASTVGESRARGMSDVMRASGQRNLSNSQAAINLTEVRSRSLDNRLKYTQTYFENRKMNREYRAAEAGPKITEQQAERIARERAPKRASTQDVDPITGGLDWPLALTDQQFSPYREKLDAMFAQRAQKEGAIGLTSYRDIQSVTDEMLAILKGNIRSMTGTDYMQAKTFVERLATEARFPTA
jgi:hypothetical protein